MRSAATGLQMCLGMARAPRIGRIAMQPRSRECAGFAEVGIARQNGNRVHLQYMVEQLEYPVINRLYIAPVLAKSSRVSRRCPGGAQAWSIRAGCARRGAAGQWQAQSQRWHPLSKPCGKWGEGGARTRHIQLQNEVRLENCALVAHACLKRCACRACATM
jgi:hypothetical protein